MIYFYVVMPGSVFNSAYTGWVPKRVIAKSEHKLFILDYFGSLAMRDQLKIDMRRQVLTAFGSEWNTFLGFYINDTTLPQGTLLHVLLICCTVFEI